MWRQLCLLAAVVGGVAASPQYYGLPLPSQQSLFKGPASVAPTLSDFSSQTQQLGNPSSAFQSFPRDQSTNPISQINIFDSSSQTPQAFNPSFQGNSKPNFAFQRNQISNPSFQTGSALQSDFSQTQNTNFPGQFNRPPVRSGIENHPFLHGNPLELLPPLQHVVGTKFPRVEAGVGFRFPTSQLLNITPPPNLL